jgi:hypothetical protein
MTKEAGMTGVTEMTEAAGRTEAAAIKGKEGS